MIRKATVSDLEQLCILERRCFEKRRFSREHIRWLLENPDVASYVYCNREKVVASVVLMRMGRTGKVVSLGVDPDYRRRGIAKHLMGLGEKEMRNRGVISMHLEVGIANEAAIELYKCLGYETVRRIPEYYSWGEDAFTMTKRMSRL
ncbi:MAG: GNAT family N-acetyltransferase [Thermoplasmata archaeon]